MAKLRCIGGSLNGQSVNIPDGAIDFRHYVPQSRTVSGGGTGYPPRTIVNVREVEELYRSRLLRLKGPFFQYEETALVFYSVSEAEARKTLAGMGICPNADTLIQPQVAVNSTAIRSVGYDDKAQQLDIVLRESGAYRYSNVPTSVVMQFLASPSKGRFYGSNIKGQYESKKLAL
jgi:hypothetical protein